MAPVQPSPTKRAERLAAGAAPADGDKNKDPQVTRYERQRDGPCSCRPAVAVAGLPLPSTGWRSLPDCPLHVIANHLGPICIPLILMCRRPCSRRSPFQAASAAWPLCTPLSKPAHRWRQPTRGAARCCTSRLTRTKMPKPWRLSLRHWWGRAQTRRCAWVVGGGGVVVVALCCPRQLAGRASHSSMQPAPAYVQPSLLRLTPNACLVLTAATAAAMLISGISLSIAKVPPVLTHHITGHQPWRRGHAPPRCGLQ